MWIKSINWGGKLEEREYWIYWQLLLPGSGRKIWDLVHHFGSPKLAWDSTESDLSEMPFLGTNGAKKLAKRKKSLQIAKVAEYLKKINCRVLTFADYDYPTSLKKIYDPPPAIFVRGNISFEGKPTLAIVGSRNPSPYGLAVAESFSSELAALGCSIISGMARGIDSAAHLGALKSNGTTVAVLGCGPDVAYPKENVRLMNQIIEKGAVITEFPPGTAPEPWHFPCRNRIISGLSDGVLVIEAAEKSGSLITADFALEQGREVMAIPGNINNKKSVGTNKLIRQGASLITSPQDIIEELGLGEINLISQKNSLETQHLTVSEKKIFDVLSHSPMSIEQILNASSLAPQEVGAVLTLLEIKSLIRVLPGKLYVTAGL